MPSAIAEAFVTLRPDTKNFERDAQAQIGAPLSKIAKGAGALFASVGAARLLGDAIGAARESNKVAAQTEAVIRSTGNAANVTAKQMSDLANSIARKTGIDDEQIQSGANLLRTFTNIRNEAGKNNDIFTQTTKIAVDMSAALGQDMSSSAIQLGKALNDPIRGITALQRVGVSFTQQQRDQIKTLVESGRTLDAQKVILAELTKEFGGSAAAQATAADRLRVSVGNIEESIGNLLIPALDHMATGIDTGISFIEKMPSSLKAAGGAIAVTAGGLLAYSKTVDIVKSASERLNGVFGKSETGAGRLGTAFKVLGGVGVAAGVVVTLKQIHDEMDKVNVDFEELASASDKELVRAFESTQKWGESSTKVFKAVADASVTDGQRLIDALKAQGKPTEDLQKILDGLIGKKKQADTTSRKNAEAISGETDAQDKNNKVTADAVTIAKNAADADDRRRQIIDDMTKALDDRRNAVLADADSEVALARADDAAQDALNAYNDAVKEHGAKSDEARRKVLDYRDSLSNAAQAAVDAANKDREAHGQAALTVQEKVGIQIAELGKLKGALDPKSPLRQVVDDYINRLKDIPTEISTNLKIFANAVPDLQVTYHSGPVARRAMGGPVRAGVPYIVGERRPELFVPRTDGTIVPSVPSAGGAVGLAPMIGTLELHGSATESDVGMLTRELRALRWEMAGVW